VAKGGGWKNQLTNFAVGVVATMVGVSALKAIWGSRSSSSSSAPASSSTTSTAQNDPSASSYSPTQSSQLANVYQSQRRAAEHGKGLDSSGESLSPRSYGLKMMLLTVLSLLPGRQKQKPDPFWIKIGEEKVRVYLQFLKRDHRRATSHLELLSRADLGEALKLFSRVLDELD
jgi:hypothetical protein